MLLSGATGGVLFASLVKDGTYQHTSPRQPWGTVGYISSPLKNEYSTISRGCGGNCDRHSSDLDAKNIKPQASIKQTISTSPLITNEPTNSQRIRVKAPGGPNSQYATIQKRVKELGLSTVCQEAKCPNISECWKGGTVTLMLLGSICTRGCRFCAVATSSTPPAPDPDEPLKVAKAIGTDNFKCIVLTTVDRDDLPDGGAAHIAETVRLAKKNDPQLIVEALVGDFQGSEPDIATVAKSGLDVFAHNLETVERLQRTVRDRRANYQQSLRVLRTAKIVNPHVFTKTSLMLGLGETMDEVLDALRDARKVAVDVVTFGQYLKPTAKHLPVAQYLTQGDFDEYKRIALDLGFSHVASGPLVRSSYKAADFMEHMRNNLPSPLDPNTNFTEKVIRPNDDQI